MARPKIQLPVNPLPVQDATEDLIIHILPIDVETGDPENPATCAIANAAKRVYDIPEVEILNTKAHLRFPDDDFETRFTLLKQGEDFVRSFDDRVPLLTDKRGGFDLTLRAPTPGRTIEAEKRQKETRMKKEKEGLHVSSRRKHSQSAYAAPRRVRAGRRKERLAAKKEQN